jgi:hypothetical protein
MLPTGHRPNTADGDETDGANLSLRDPGPRGNDGWNKNYMTRRIGKKQKWQEKNFY